MSGERVEIAIVGMAGRFPGADSVAALWRMICEQQTGIRRLSDDELRADGMDPTVPGLVPYGGQLEDVGAFDANFFSFSRKEAELTDPQHRWMLEVAWQAFEDAAHVPHAIDGPVGVFLGSAVNAYGIEQLLAQRAFGTSTFQHLMGLDPGFLATRVAYKLGLTGPAISLQTACSTSLVAIAMACQHLIDFSVDFALAGGVTIGVPHHTGYVYEEGGIFASDGACRAFDARADGTVPGSGVAAVVLRRLEDAQRDGDDIYAVIRGTAVNNDGDQKVGYTAPSVSGQAACIAAALADADVDPRTIGLVEAHGTGTQLGDPIELAALTRVYRERTSDVGYCAIGSVKTNVGHLNAASGVTGLIKAALALRHATLPPTRNFETPNDKLGLETSPFYVCTERAPWPATEHPRRAAVSSFGFGGTNAHAVLEEAPPRAAAASTTGLEVICVSAHTRAALDATSADLATAIAASSAPLGDIASTLQHGRKALRHRRIVVARDAGEAAAKLGDERTSISLRAADAPPPVIFMFTGQGAQHDQMARRLYADHARFRAAIDDFSRLVESEGGPRLGALLTGAPDLSDTALVQPLMVGIGLALAACLADHGVEPAAVLGHSLGELAAATVAGVLEPAAAARLVVARGRAMHESEPGGMLVVWASPDEVAPLLPPGIVVAAHNAAELIAVSGREDELAAAAAALTEAGVRSRRLPGRCGFHSALMDPACERLRAVGARLPVAAPKLPMLSNVTGGWHDGAPAPGYWADHARSAVLFHANLTAALADPRAVLVELGPGSSLAGLASQHADHGGRPTIVTLPGAASAKGDAISEPELLATALGRLWAAGVEVAWPRRGRRVRLPGVRFQRRHFWLAPAARTASPPAASPTSAQTSVSTLGVNALVDVL